MKIKDNPELLEEILSQEKTTNRKALEFVSSLSDLGLVFEVMMRELNDKPKSWLDDPKYDGLGEIMAFHAEALLDVVKSNDARRAACIAFLLATGISCIKGNSRRFEDVVQRFDAMSVEIDDVISEFNTDGKQLKAVHVWNELIKRCGQPGSCCISLENDQETDEQIIVWGRPGGAVERMKYSTLQRRLVRKKRR